MTDETPGSLAGDPDDAGKGDACFDASQYAFFGNDVVEEFELGGLEDDGDNGSACLGGIGNEELQLSSIGYREEGEDVGPLSQVDDLTNTFSKLNEDVGDLRNAGSLGNSGSYSNESFTTDRFQDSNFTDWIDQRVLHAENVWEDKRWQSHPQNSSVHVSKSNSLYRTTSYPHQQPQLQNNNLSEPISVMRPSFPSFPPARVNPQVSPSYSQNPNLLPYASGVPISSSAASQHHLPGLPYGNMSQFTSSALSNLSTQYQQSHEFKQTNALLGEPRLLPNMLPHSLHHRNGIMDLQMSQQQQRAHPFRPTLPHLSYLRSPPTMNKLEVLGMVAMKDSKERVVQRGRRNFNLSHPIAEASSHGNTFCWPQFRSKYMSSEEIENIMRMQHAATHSSDPYVDDYYHQACLAKMAARSGLKRHFCPPFLRDFSSRTHANNEPHAYLQVDALGRLPFSSIRRPRPLLEVDPPTSSSGSEHRTSVKSLEQEPMLAARTTIEDGLCVLLDVDDIDRLFEYGQPLGEGPQLRRRRQTLLEGLATSLQLVDPLAPGVDGQSPNDDIIFLRLASLPKGMKLLSRFLHLLSPGNELTRVVCMAIFRHLRFLFSGSRVSDTAINLSTVVSSTVHSMDLNGLSACLAAIVCSSEQPPLRPLGTTAGDGATIVIISVLKRATEILTDRHAASSCSVHNRELWQASFDSFFDLLIQHCFAKYESVMKLQQRTSNTIVIASDASKAISQEMPVELLRASIPHTDENQRKRLFDLAQRSMSASGFSDLGDGGRLV